MIEINGKVEEIINQPPTITKEEIAKMINEVTCFIEGAEPRINGTWLPASDGDGIVCSNCGNDFCTVFISVEKWNYCPICGSKMRYENE